MQLNKKTNKQNTKNKRKNKSSRKIIMWSKLGWKSKNEKRGESLSAGGRWAAQLQEWKPRRNRDFSFLNGDSKNNPPLSSTDCWEHPVEERLNGWVRVWDRAFLCGLGVEWGPLSALEALSEQGEQVVALVALFWASRKREGGREGGHAPLVMYRDLAWAHSHATHTHPHQH